MLYNVYTVFDRVAKHYHVPFYERGQNQAIAAFKKACISPETILNQFPDSYVLVKIGTYDDEQGTFENQESEVIALATEFVDVKENSDSNS